MNKVVLVGRLTKDIDLRSTQSGTEVASFTIAVNRTFQNAQGEREADFINCVAWRQTAVNMREYLRKGSLIGVEGRLQTRSYETDNGTRYVTEVQCEQVHFLESKSSRDDNSGNNYSNNGYNKSYTNNNNSFANNGNNNKTNNNSSSEEEEDDFYGTTKKLSVSDEDLPF